MLVKDETTVDGILSILKEQCKIIENLVYIVSLKKPTLNENNSPWPTAQFTSACYFCHYFGHQAADCPNVKAEYQMNLSKTCYKCLKSDGHFSMECNNPRATAEELKKFLISGYVEPHHNK